MTKADWYLAFSWLLVLIVAILVGSYFIVNNINQCTSQPLEYAVKQVHDKFDVKFVYGRLNLVNEEYQTLDYIDFGDVNATIK